MKSHKIVFMMFLVSFSAAAQSKRFVNEISTEATRAIQSYFEYSNRKYEKIDIQGFSRLDSMDTYFLAEAGVVAQSPHGQEMIDYNCGVFLKKMVLKWTSEHTECEPLDYVSRRSARSY